MGTHIIIPDTNQTHLGITTITEQTPLTQPVRATDTIPLTIEVKTIGTKLTLVRVKNLNLRALVIDHLTQDSYGLTAIYASQIKVPILANLAVILVQIFATIRDIFDHLFAAEIWGQIVPLYTGSTPKRVDDIWVINLAIFYRILDTNLGRILGRIFNF